MQFQSNHQKARGLAILETAGMLSVIAFFSIIAFGVMDFYSTTFVVRRIVEKVLAEHTQSVLQDKIDLNGNVVLSIATDRVKTALKEEIAQIKSEFVKKLPDIEGENEYRIEAEIRIASIDTVTGKFNGFEPQAYIETAGRLQVSSMMEEQNSLEASFQALADQRAPQETSFLAEPSPDKGYDLSTWNYLPLAAVSGIRVFIQEKRAPMQFANLHGGGGNCIMDIKTMILRGGLK